VTDDRRGAFMLSGEIQIRVRYAETDRMGLLHHANYLVYFEQARTELLRGRHASYKELEDQGFFLVVAKAEVKFKSPAHYDDVLNIRTTVVRTSPVRLEHKYEVTRDGTLIAEGLTTLACVGRDGKLREMPAWLAEAK
jgi:acyl-CoA thioester hydrolase